MLLSAFTIGKNDNLPEVIALVLYGLTILPACIIAVWHRVWAANWLIALSLVTVLGLGYQFIQEAS